VVVGDDPDHRFTIGCNGVVLHGDYEYFYTVLVKNLVKPLNLAKDGNLRDNVRNYYEFELDFDKNETVRSIIADL